MEDQHDSLFLRRDPTTSSSSAADKGEYGLVAGATLMSEEEGAFNTEQNDGEDLPSHNHDLLVEEDVDDENDNNNDADSQQGHSMGLSVPFDYTESFSFWRIPRKWQRILLTPLLPDDRVTAFGISVLDGLPAVRFLKFATLTWIGLILMFQFVRCLEFEHDGSYTIPDMMLYDGQAILMDTMFFFTVGRLYRQRGVDHIAWMLVAFASGLFSSGETRVSFLQNSVTLYSMHCLWPWQLWLFAIVVIAVCGLVLVQHVQYLLERQLLAIKATEMTLCVLFLLLPLLTSPYFHFHHWFAGWLVGMHCNLDVWWSRLTMAWCWGAYINGIAVYGRDPLLTCGYSFYLSLGDHCPYLQCYIDAMTNHSNHSHYQPMEPQDWRNCSAEDYKP